MKFLITALMFFSVNLYAEAMTPNAKAINMSEDKIAPTCAYLETHIEKYHNTIVEIESKANAAVDAGVRPSNEFTQYAAKQWEWQQGLAAMYGNLRCFERSNAPKRTR